MKKIAAWLKTFWEQRSYQISQTCLGCAASLNIGIGIGNILDEGSRALLAGTWLSVGFTAAMILTNIHAQRAMRVRQDMFKTIREQQEMIDGLMQMKVAEIGASIAKRINGALIDAPTITKH